MNGQTHIPTNSNWSHERSAGVLMPVFSLPGAYGIGDMGQAAYQFAEGLSASGQRFWQILPLNPTNSVAGDSPYFSSSAFAGNPLLISLETLVSEGLISEASLERAALPEAVNVDYDTVRRVKTPHLRQAAAAFIEAGGSSAFDAFVQAEAFWLEDYALFMSLSNLLGETNWSNWPTPLRDRDPKALEEFTAQHYQELMETKVLQFFFFKQWRALKQHCNDLGLLIFGDMPIYVSYESADVWTNPSVFKLDDAKRPTMVSGVPPDYFSATGQLWNNPVYNWETLKATNFDWWVKRMGSLFALYDIVRIDHFRGLVQYWEVPAGSETAINGSWEDVPTHELFDTLRSAHPAFSVVAEDLGIITPDVVAVKEHYGLPGMLVLHFAFFDDHDDNPYKPHNHSELAVVYLGTHDNNTTEGWFNEVDDQTKGRLASCIDGGWDALSTKSFVKLALDSRANIAILSLQDLLELPARARINDPSKPWENWRWRLTQEEFDAIPFHALSEATQASGRLYPAS